MESNNKGFSLVELLVSIAILAIIMVPVLDTIVMSARTNKKSRETQNATMLAGNLLETTKLESDLSSMAEKLLSEDGKVYNELFGMDVTSNIQIEEMEPNGDSFIKAKQSCIETKPGEPKTFKENETGTYYFAVKNLSYNNRCYDALITYDASAYRTKDANINSKSVPVMNQIATKDNAVITEGYRQDWAASILYRQYQEWISCTGREKVSMTADEIKEHMERTVTISVNKDAHTNKYVVDATVTYILNKIPNTDSATEKAYRSYQNTLFHSEFDSLENIYYFYTPDLNSKKDQITVDNKVAEDFDVYVVEQAQAVKDYKAEMKQYELKLTLKEEDEMAPHKIMFYTNVGQAHAAEPTIKDTLGASGELYKQGALPKENNKARLYEVRVAIYDSASIQKFDKKDVLTTITSAKGVE